VRPGEIGLAYILFGKGAEIPPTEVQYELTVKTSSLNTVPHSWTSLKVTEANLSGDAVVGAAVNATGKSLEGPFDVDVYCFDGDRLLIQHDDSAAQEGPIAPNGQVTFSVALNGSRCPTFALGVKGFD
jgi:hypothetical protein